MGRYRKLYDYISIFLEASIWKLVPRKSRAKHWDTDGGPTIVTNVVLILGPFID